MHSGDGFERAAVLNEDGSSRAGVSAKVWQVRQREGLAAMPGQSVKKKGPDDVRPRCLPLVLRGG
jgi:hypothetical protein